MMTFYDIFRQGGIPMAMIAATSCVAWYMAMRNWKEINDLLRDLRSVGTPDCDIDLMTANLDHAHAVLQAHLMKLTSSTSVIKNLAALLPLLGLLGTVLGMLLTFDVIALHGTSNPSLLAGGIRQALMTTQAGLFSALLLLFFHHALLSRLRTITNESDLIFHKLQSGSNPEKDQQIIITE
ncbi:MAG: MotA/TolQ/ExbB proton channel family protein [Planctomycetes bacterium]|nr:MotA/TolQ/ExbB proton channel family protein [Planctomycetota bacterium]